MVATGAHEQAIPLRGAPTNVTELLASTMGPLERQAAELDIGFQIEAGHDVPKSVWLDPEKIAWAVTTLVGNSFRYVKRGTRRMPGGSIGVRLEYDAKTNELVISVHDDGSGIPEDKLPFLFKRAAGAPHAAGLGLMLVYDVVTAHGGSIDVQSSTRAFDHGTTVILRIPARLAPV